jgi:ParB family transcriptional regulator, chromosome partitioning protein
MSGTLEHLNPTSLLIGDNVRDNAELDKPFIASIAEHVVLQPITAVRSDAGVEVRDGQRRTLAARLSGLAAIPVYVLDTTDASDPQAANAERIAQQIVANDQREALTDAQRVKGISQMLLTGVSPARVAKKLSVGRDTVAAAANVAKSQAALDALQSGQLSLTEAAALREFEGDERAIGALMSVAGTASFDHRVAQLHQERIAEEARTESESVYADKGFLILEDRPLWRDPARVSLRHLRTADGGEATKAAVTDPTQWAVFMIEDTLLVDAATGERVVEDDVDGTLSTIPSATPPTASGMPTRWWKGSSGSPSTTAVMRKRAV